MSFSDSHRTVQGSIHVQRHSEYWQRCLEVHQEPGQKRDYGGLGVSLLFHFFGQEYYCLLCSWAPLVVD